jgi:predicted nucleic acid-binding protein
MPENLARIAFDANIFFYAVDQRDAGKHRRCAEILNAAANAGLGCAALQALGEFCYASVRKGMLTRREAAAAAKDWASVFEPVAASERAFDAALHWWSEERLSWWDALLVATAADAGVTALISEDLHDGAIYDGVEIVNPFASNAGARLSIHGFEF